MLNRRQFLLGLGGGATLAGLGPLWGCSRAEREAPLILARHESWANTVCQLCPSGCGLRVRLVNDRPVTISGNPLHPVNRGGLCARGAATLQLYYDPDRLPGPLQRDRSVVGGWAPISWEDAISGVASRLQAAAVSPGRVAVIRSDSQNLTAQLLGRLVRAAGSSWVVDLETPAEQAMEEVLQQMHGTSGRLVYDLANADALLSLDSSLLEPSSSTMSLHRGFAEMRSSGGYFIHAGPRLGVTGGKADEWLPIRASTAGVFALGVAHMLIKEGYARNDFLRDHVSGFEDWTDEAGVHHTGTRSWILREFSPQRVAELSGAGWDQIIRVARRFGSAQRPLAIGPVQGDTSFQTFDAIAVHTLNAILGAIDVPGGVLLARRAPFDSLDDPPRTSPEAGRLHRSPTVDELADWVLQSKSPPIDICFVHEADPVFTTPEGDKLTEALRKIPFVVSTSPVMDDTSTLASIILPSSLWLERRCDAIAVEGNGYPVVSASPAAVKPAADGRNMADVVLTLARRVGGRVAEQLPWQSYDDLMRERVDVLFRSGVGDTFSAQHRSTWAQLLERSGWRAVSYKTADQLGAEMAERGGWWDPAYYHGEWRRVVPPAGHRINLQAAQLLTGWQPPARAEGAEDGRLVLYVYPELALSTRTSGSIPYLQDLGSPLWQSSWVTVAEVNPRTAEHLHLKSGERIKIKNDRGEITAQVRTSPGIRPDVVAVHSGGGRVQGGRYAAGIGSNPLRLVKMERSSDSQRVRREPTLVRIERL